MKGRLFGIRLDITSYCQFRLGYCGIVKRVAKYGRIRKSGLLMYSEVILKRMVAFLLLYYVYEMMENGMDERDGFYCYIL